jgi:cell division protease FtsH
VQKVTLIPRGQARGLTWFIPGDDPTLISKQQIFARIVGALGGRATEEVVFGDAEVTTGAASDLQQVTSMAKQVRSCSYWCSWVNGIQALFWCSG